jgi:hypothetical protein
VTVPAGSDEIPEEQGNDAVSSAPTIGATGEATGEEVIDAVWALIEVVRRIASRVPVAEARAERAAAMRAGGMTYSDIIRASERPLLLQTATMDLEAIAAAGTRLRRIGARVLREEGMSIDQIAKEFGVSRQRVSRLLHADPDTSGPHWLKSNGA